MIQGVIFVACVLLFRRGIVGEIVHLIRPRNRAEKAAAAAHSETHAAAGQSV